MNLTLRHDFAPRAGIGLLVLLAVLLGAPLPGQAEVVISEFMASNTKTFADEDGSFEDWIELRNTGSETINLQGWFLTDSPAQPTKWPFPATNITAKGFLVIFASNKDRDTPGKPLHTNFKLGGGGEYLALIQPDGLTVASEYAPLFPPQVSDVSFGLDTGLRRTIFLATNAPGKLWIPADDALGKSWVTREFNDVNWRNATSGVGFAIGALGNVPVPGLTNALAAYWKLDETNGTVAIESSGSSSNATLVNFPSNNSKWVAGRIDGGLKFLGSNNYVRATNYTKATNRLSVSAWVWADNRPFWGSIAKNWGSTKPGQFHFGLRESAGDLDVIIHTSAGDFEARENTLFPTGQWQHVAFTADGSVLRLFRNGALVAGGAYTGDFLPPPMASLGIGVKLKDAGTAPDADSPGYWAGKLDDVALWNRGLDPAELQAIYEAGSALPDYIKTNIRPSLLGSNATCLLRFPFVADDPAALTRWLLRVRYDDGFVAWLNGEEIVRRNAPELLSWNAAATDEHPTAEAMESEEFDLAAFTPLLLPGTNILAFQGLNLTADDPDFLLQPYLEASSVTNTTNALVYFTAPTPGAENRVGVSVLGPIIGQVEHTPNVPADHEDLLVTARVTPAFGLIASVSLRYRVMYGTETNAAMFDDGTHGDRQAGDGLYAAMIPATLSTNGQMIRYFVSALDTANRPSRLPLFKDPSHSDQYFGTVVQNTNINTPLPVIQWFVEKPAEAETGTGTRCSIFYNGEFYDNVKVRIRGGTSLNWPKKSYKFELNEDHEFLRFPGEGRVTEFDLNTTYTDKSYARSVLTYEHQRDAGLPSPVAFLVHLRQNTLFYSVTVYTEQPDKDFLKRVGLDETGALYKCGPGSKYDTLEGFEKKTREFEGTADAQAFVTRLGLSGVALDNFVFDNVDLPGQINFLATVAITQNIDASDKNHFLYRDSEGSREWRMLPWDQDLTFGPNALNTDTIVFKENFASHPFIGAGPYLLHDGKYNRFIEAVVKTARGRQMLLRRIRTLSDQFLATSYFQDSIERIFAMANGDVQKDHARWGANADFGGSAYTLRQALDRIKNEYLAPRVPYLAGSGITDIGAAMPASQPSRLNLAIDELDFNPASGVQAQEYVRLTNAYPYAVDLTGWRLTGEVEYLFKPGTVIPSNSVLYLSPDVAQFRSRSTGPRGGQGLFVQGNYQGRLSARGGVLKLLDSYGRQNHLRSYGGAPSLAQQFLRVSEIMFNPAPPPPGAAATADDFEYIELKNISPSVILDLTGVRFTAGIEFDFTSGAITSLAPGQTVLVVKNASAFAARHGASLPVAGSFAGSLDKGGELLRIEDASGEKVLEFAYNDHWHPIADGHGFSLVIRDENAGYDTWGAPESWRPSASLNGSPGGDDPNPPPLPQVLVNEVLTHSVSPAGDAIELHNPSGSSASVGGWFITDDFRTPNKFRIPNGITIPPGGYRVFTEADFNPGGAGFSFGADGDDAWLFSADAAGHLTGYAHGFAFGPSALGVSFGRHIDSQGGEHFVAQGAKTVASANSGPRVDPVVISEIMFHPPAGETSESLLEFVEVQNVTAHPVPLYDPANPTNRWRLSGAVDFDFPPNMILPAGARLVVTGFDPAADSDSLARFRAAYGLGQDTAVLGPWKGRLDNRADILELETPNPPNGAGVPYVLVESVHYRDEPPWPGADGNGASLHRRMPLEYGEDPASWTSATPNPGRAYEGGVVPIIDSEPADQTVVAYNAVSLSVTATGSTPLRFRWRRNGSPLAGATNATLTFSRILPQDFGDYQAEAYNAAGSVLSSSARLTVNVPATITSPPQSRSILVLGNVTFSVIAAGAGPLAYQWRRNGEDLPGATGPSLTLTGIRLSDEGAYTVVITDEIGAITSAPAFLRVLAILVPPTPASQTVLQGSVVRVLVTATGTEPLSYRWRRNSAVVNGQTNALLFFTNAQPSQSGTYSVTVTDMAGSLAGGSSVLSVLADSDRDGMADEWETSFGLNPGSAADASLDSDGDTMRNLAEYMAGTNPTNALDYLMLTINQRGVGGQTASLQFPAISNRTYRVLYRDALDAGGWMKLADVPARSTNRVEEFVEPAPNTNRFYRLVTPQPPGP